jgi:drug/metabolite transporter (DMT)-like permease
METPAPPSAASRWLFDRPYLLLSLTSLFWAGNAVVGRFAAGRVPPVTLSFLRWTFAFLIVLPFAWPHLKRDWPAISARLPLMLTLSAAGIGAFNTLQYISLQYTTALNVLLLQSVGPLFIAVWSLILLGIRLTLAQGIGIAVSTCGVIAIVTQGNPMLLSNITLNRGDMLFLLAMLIFGGYSVLALKRPAMHALSFAAFTFGIGALCILPVFAWELATHPAMELAWSSFLTIGYVSLFPSVLAYLCYNRGFALIGANRAAPFIHLVPVFGSVLAIVVLGERPMPSHLVGYVLVLCGIFVAARKPKTAATSETHP